jgi:hypothetical protein
MQTAFNEFGTAYFNNNVIFSESLGVLRDAAWTVGNSGSLFSTGVFHDGIKPYTIMFPISSGESALNLHKKIFFYYHLTGDVSISNPINGKNGQYFIMIFKQGGTGGHGVNFDSGYVLPSSYSSISTGVGSYTVIESIVIDDKSLCSVVNY